MRTAAIAIALALTAACATTQQRQETVARAGSIARAVCTVCNNVCRVIPGTAQYGAPAPAATAPESAAR